MPENNDGKAVDALTHAVILPLGGRFVRAGVIVKPDKLHVVGTLGGRHIRLEAEGGHRDGIFSDAVFFGGAAVRHHKAALEFALVILALVILRGSTLHVKLRPGESKTALGVYRVGEGAGDGLLVALVLRQLVTFQNEIRQVARELLLDDTAVCIVDPVALVAGEQRVDILRVGDHVVENLSPREVVVVDPDGVNIHGAVAAPDGNACRFPLRKIVSGGILHRAGHHAVDIAADQPVFRPLFHHEADADVFVFLELHGNFRLFGDELRLLRRDQKSSAARQTAENHRVIVHDLPRGKFQLYRLAGRAEVAFKYFVWDMHPRIARNAQRGDALVIRLPSVGFEIEARQFGGNLTAHPFGSVFLGVAPALGFQAELKRVGFRVCFDVGWRDGNGNAPAHPAGGYFKGKIARFVHAAGKVLSAPADRLCGKQRAVLLHRDFRVH